MRIPLLAVICLVLAVAGCATRSISDSGYPGRHGNEPGNPLYAGELSEFDVLGIDAGQEISEEKILAAYVEDPSRTLLRKGDRILLIQSGAMMPDAEMLAPLESTFSITAFSGIPESGKSTNASYASALRLAAAKAGIPTIVVYWGLIESGIENLATKTVSWIPVLGSVLPDEAQSMRIRLKVAVVDVRSGRWEMWTPELLDDRAYSARINRAQSDQAQVLALKTAAYHRLADDLVTRFIR